jgi:hypothetical protein
MTQEWVVEIEVGGHPSPRSVARPSASRSVAAGEDAGWSMSLRVDAANPLQAARRALELLRPGGPVTRLQVLTVAAAERQLVSPRLPDLVGMLDVHSPRARSRHSAARAGCRSPSRPAARVSASYA